MAAAITRTAVFGVRQVLDEERYVAKHPDRRQYVYKCWQCLRMWDDGIVTQVTPTPAARCPFEYSHRTRR